MLSGLLEARFTPSADGLMRARVSARPPLELRGPFVAGSVSGYYLRNTTAGVLAGDTYSVDVMAGSGASVRVGASSATKVHAGASSLDVRLAVEPGALLVWGPHATILHAGASYRQETRVTLAPGGRVVLAEVLVLGRLAHGEWFQLECLENVLGVSPPACAPLFSESYVLRPGPDLVASMAGRGVLVSVYALGFDALSSGPVFDAVLGRSSELCGWSELPNHAGLAGRALAESLSRGTELASQMVEAVTKANR